MIFRSGRSEFAIIAVSPAMIGATQEAGVLAISAAHAHPAMPAGIEKGPHDPLVVAHQNGWVQAALPADQVSRVGNFTFVAEKEPAAAEDTLDLHLIDVGIGEDAPRDQSFLRPHDVFQMLPIGQPGKAVQRCIVTGTVTRRSDRHSFSPPAAIGFCRREAVGRLSKSR